jgi:predicted dehydrogenase/aryl-alcohol dehydrogenase-like predicted oxidoreductase
MSDRLAWGIIGAGGIARAFARGLATSKTGALVAIGSRSQASADAFGAEFGLSRCHGSYAALLADPAVQAVYIATPHPMHAEWAVKAADAGKHILCEKPLTMNWPEAMAVVEAARRNDVFLMEAFMYRCHPQTRRLVELIADGAIGEVRVIQATFSFHANFDPERRLFNPALGGGGILDVGCYTASMARLVAGVAQGLPFADPIEVKGVGHLGDTGVDEWALAVLKFPGDIVAELSTGVQVSQDNTVRIFGSRGNIVVPSPWFCTRNAGTSTLLLTRDGKTEEVAVEADNDLYAIEADTVAAHLAARQAPSPAMSWADSLGNARTLDRWREAIGLVYNVEKPAAWTLPVNREPLRVREAVIPHGEVAGVGKPVSRLVMGTMVPTTIVYASVLFDDFIERGGTAFDTAYVYGGGKSEVALGQWVKNRGLRDHVVIAAKGAIPPFCTPEGLTQQLYESLDRLQMDYVDIYMLHRDNLDVPIGEFVDVLNEHVRAGRIRAFGGSNWTMARLDAANAYAASHGLQGMAAVSNNFSLARMVNPVWAGTLASSDPESRAWLTRTQMPLFAWSSQARGFFVLGNPETYPSEEIVRCWYSDDNFRRLERARALAAARGVDPINVALGYVLAQPFPTYALVGPQTIDETRNTLQALTLGLTPDECAWLNLERE